MKTARHLVLATVCLLFILSASSCSVFGPKYGCPASGKNMGAEKVLEAQDTGKKIPKARKFKA